MGAWPKIVRGSGYALVLVIGVSTAPGALAESSGRGRNSVQVSPEARCASLANAEFSDAIDVAPRVTHAQLAKSPQASYCSVRGTVTSVFDFEVRLPSRWNGKLLGLGSVSTNGDECDSYLSRGYACTPMFRGGRVGRTDAQLIALSSPEMQIDLALRSTHLLTLAAKSIVNHYYATPPSKSYFIGCSSGGYQAMLEAQVYPWDYDGIVAGAPNLDTADWLMRAAWSGRKLLDDQGRPLFSDGDLRTLHGEVLAQCDQDDGLADGLISDAVNCKPRLANLQCSSTKPGACLSTAQLRAAEQLYSGPATTAGEQTSAPGVLPGSELGWNELSGTWLKLATTHFEFVYYGAKPKLSSFDFNFDQDYKRRGLGALQVRTNPDLRRFKAAGGKLLAYQGANDTAQVAGAVVDYYETVERLFGGRPATQEFFRLFMVPGMNHCTGGVGGYAIDYLTYLEAWVERGQAPDALIGAHVDKDYLASAPLSEYLKLKPASEVTRDMRVANGIRTLQFPLAKSIPVEFTRPVYPYPLYAKYKGSGDPKDARSFGPAFPPPDALHISRR